jgi:hypothetical protein
MRSKPVQRGRPLKVSRLEVLALVGEPRGARLPRDGEALGASARRKPAATAGCVDLIDIGCGEAVALRGVLELSA